MIIGEFSDSTRIRDDKGTGGGRSKRGRVDIQEKGASMEEVGHAPPDRFQETTTYLSNARLNVLNPDSFLFKNALVLLKNKIC